MGTFFSTLVGNAVVLIAAAISITLYRHCIQISQRGLVVRRVKMTQSAARLGQRPIDSVVEQNILSGQSHQAATN
jgi:hypothetical protein